MRVNRNQFTNIIVILTVVCSLGLAACGGGGGGGGGDGGGPGGESTYDLSGTITKSGGGALQGVTMNLSGTSSGTATTDASGNYTFTGLANGSYTITPTLAGYVFNPVSQAVTINGVNVTTIKFVAADNTPPTVISTFPTDGATGVDTSSTISATFSENIDPSTVSNSFFVLDTYGAYVSGTVSCSGATATFTPSSPLSKGTSYTVKITTEVKDLAGNPLAMDLKWLFITLLSWNSEQEFYSPYISTVVDFDLKVNDNEQAACIWSEQYYDIYSSEYDTAGIYGIIFSPGYGWSAIQALNDSFCNLSNDRKLAMDNQGNVLTIWGSGMHIKGGYDDVWSIYNKQYNHNTGWGNTYGDGIGASPAIAMNGNGYGVKAWIVDEYNYFFHISASLYNPNSGWDTPFVLVTDYSLNAANPSVAISSSGNVIVTWEKNGTIYARKYNISTGWGTEEIVGSGTGAQAKIDDNNNIIVVWENGTTSILGRTCSGGIWGNVFNITSGPGYITRFSLGISFNGNYAVVWGKNNIFCKRYNPSSGWQETESVESFSYGSDYPDVAIENSGKVIVVWQQLEYVISGSDVQERVWLYSNHYDSGMGWAIPQLVTSNYQISKPKVVMNNNGKAFVGWLRNKTLHISIGG